VIKNCSYHQPISDVPYNAVSQFGCSRNATCCTGSHTNLQIMTQGSFEWQNLPAPVEEALTRSALAGRKTHGRFKTPRRQVDSSGGLVKTAIDGSVHVKEKGKQIKKCGI